MTPPCIDPRQAVVTLAPYPGALGISLTVWPDPRAAPDEAASIVSMLALAVVTLQGTTLQLAQRLAALEVLASETARQIATIDAPAGGVARDEARHAVALAAVDSSAALILLAPAAAPSEAGGDEAGAPAAAGSALDALIF